MILYNEKKRQEKCEIEYSNMYKLLGSYYSYKNLEGIFVILVDLLSGSASIFGESSFIKSLTASLLLPV